MNYLILPDLAGYFHHAMASSWGEFIGTTATCPACAGVVWGVSNTLYFPPGDVCVIHRWVTPNSYRKWHTIEPWYDKCAEYVQWKGNNRSWAAALKWFPDGNGSGIIDEQGKGKLHLWKQKGSIKNYFLVDDQLWKLKKRWVLSIILWDSFNLIEGPELSNLFNLLRSSQVPANKCPCDSRRYLGKQIFQMAVFRLDIRVPVEIPSVGYKLPSNGSLWFRPKLLYWHSSCPMEIPL